MAFSTITVLQNAQTTGNGTTFSNPSANNITIYLRGNGSVTAGAVTLEEDADGTATTWNTILSTPTSPVTLTVGTNVTQAVHLTGGCYGSIRARISTTVTGGTLTATAFANANI